MINLLKNGELVNNDLKIAQIPNEYFTNITNEQDIKENEANLSLAINIENPIDKSVSKYKSHHSIKIITKQSVPQELFESNEVDAIDVFDQLKRLNPKKSSHIDSIPSKILQENFELFARILHSSFNICVKNSNFAESLKEADTSPYVTVKKN